MEVDSSILFYSTDLLNWKTNVSAQTVLNPSYPAVQLHPYGNFFSKLLSSEKLLQKYLKLFTNSFAWKISISPDGLNLVILKNNNLEFRLIYNNCDKLVFQCKLLKDFSPQWRTISWSNCSSYFGVTFSNGIFIILDKQGTKCLCNIKNNIPFDADMIVRLVISTISKYHFRVFILTIKGILIVYNVQNFKFSLVGSSQLPYFPILCCEVSSLGNYIVLGSFGYSKESSDTLQNGIMLCRFVNEAPYIISCNETMTHSAVRHRYWFSNLFYGPSDGIYIIKFTENNDKIIAIHLSGKISIWSFPSLKILNFCNASSYKSLSINAQIDSNFLSPGNFTDNFIFDICCWDNQYIVACLQNGKVMFFPIAGLFVSKQHMIYNFPFTRLERGCTKKFFSLSCSSKYTNNNLSGNNSINTKVPVVQSSYYSKTIDLIWSLFAKNDDVCFKPCQQNYELTCYQITTPDELFEIKVDQKQYTEALRLAEQYGLDADIVFQKQWRDSDKTINDIKMILIKIKKKNWILNECLERIPNDTESLRCLLKLGLKLTDSDILFEGSSSSFPDELSEMDFDDQDDSFQQQFLNVSLNLSELNLVQIEDIRIRSKLLQYLDKLVFYEEIINATHDTFDSEKFAEFKMLNSFDLAIQFANNGFIIGLEILLKFYHHDLREHILTILSNIPECLNPKSVHYRDLLLQLQMFFVFQQMQVTKHGFDRPADWCESDELQSICHIRNKQFSNNSSDVYYGNSVADELWMVLTSDENDNRRIIKKWFEWRIRQIDEQTLNTDEAWEFLKIAEEIGLEIDGNLKFNLQFLWEAIYQCQITTNMFISLKEFELLLDCDKAKLLMSKSSLSDNDHQFLLHFNRWILPMVRYFKDDRQRTFNFFEGFFHYLSTKSLVPIRKLLDDKMTIDGILGLVEFVDFLRLIIDILFNDNNVSNISECSNVITLLNSLINQRTSMIDKVEYVRERSQLSDIEKYIIVSKLLEKYNCRKSLKFIHENKANSDVVERFLTNAIVQYLQAIKTINNNVLKNLLIDFETSVTLVLTSVHPKLLFANILKSLIESGDNKKINLAMEFMDLSDKLLTISDEKLRDFKTLSFEDSLKCILSAVRNYLNMSISSKDGNFQLAKYCLSLLKDSGSNLEIVREMTLIKACEFLDKYNCPIVPIELRATKDRFLLLENCLDANKLLYKNIETIVDVGICFCKDESQPKRFNEGESLRLVARKALENNDGELVEIAISSLMNRNHQPSWLECLETLKKSSTILLSEEKRVSLGSFVITNCPDSELPNVLFLVKNMELLNYGSDSSDEHSNSSSSTSIITQPIRFLSTGIMDFSSKLSLKSVIEKSTETFSKLASQINKFDVTQQSARQELLYSIGNQRNNPTEIYLDLFYRNGGLFKLTAEKEAEEHETIAALTDTLMLVIATNSNQQNQSSETMDKINLQFILINLHRDTYLCLVHAVFIDDVSLLFQLRHELMPLNSNNNSTFSKALIYYMVALNLIFKYSDSNLAITELSDGNLLSALDRYKNFFSESHLSMLEMLEQEFRDFSLLDRIAIVYPSIDRVLFFSSVEYRRNVIMEFSESVDDCELIKFALLLADRYNIDRYFVSLAYFRAFIYKSPPKSDKEFYSDCLVYFNDNLQKFQIDIEQLILTNNDFTDSKFELIIEIFRSSKVNLFVLFGRTLKQHSLLLELYKSIFVGLKSRSIRYVDFLLVNNKSNNNKNRIIESLKLSVNSDNIDQCSELMAEFKLQNEFQLIRNDFCSVLAKQTMLLSSVPSSSIVDDKSNDILQIRFEKSLENFSIHDYEKCKEFIYSMFFEQTTTNYIDLVEKEKMLSIANRFVEKKISDCLSPTDEHIQSKWRMISGEIELWNDHIKNSISIVVRELKKKFPQQQYSNNSNNYGKLLITAEYLPPDNYWQNLVIEMLLSDVSFQDIFTLTWDLNIDSSIIESSVAMFVNNMLSSTIVSCNTIKSQITSIIEELSENLDCDSVESILKMVITELFNRDNNHDSKDEKSFELQIHLLKEYVYRIRQNHLNPTMDIRKYVLLIMKRSQMVINANMDLSSKNHRKILDSLLQQYTTVEEIVIVAQAIQLLELIQSDNLLWQYWVKSCVIKGPLYVPLVFDVFSELKLNILYNDRFINLCQEASQTLASFYPYSAISILILSDPPNACSDVQNILLPLKSNPNEFADTMKNIDRRALQIIVDMKLIPIYSRTALFQRLVNFLTKEINNPILVQEILEQLRQNNLLDEATWLASSMSFNPAQKTIEMVSGFWKKFSGGGNS